MSNYTQLKFLRYKSKAPNHRQAFQQQLSQPWLPPQFPHHDARKHPWNPPQEIQLRTWRHCHNGADAAAVCLRQLKHRLLRCCPQVPQCKAAIISACQQRCAILLLQQRHYAPAVLQARCDGAFLGG